MNRPFVAWSLTPAQSVCSHPLQHSHCIQCRFFTSGYSELYVESPLFVQHQHPILCCNLIRSMKYQPSTPQPLENTDVYISCHALFFSTFHDFLGIKHVLCYLSFNCLGFSSFIVYKCFLFLVHIF